jgi:hypothetical protein
MTMLGKNILLSHGPFVNFCILDAPLSADQVYSASLMEYKQNIFFEFSDNLLGTYCSITRSYSPFDPHFNAQYEKPYAIYQLSSELLIWEYQLARTPSNYFGMLGFYLDQLDQSGEYTIEQFKFDMLETLHFLVARMHQAAANKQCLLIVGI